MSYERTQLLANLPRYPQKQMVPVVAMTVAYSGPGVAAVTVDDQAWVVEGSSGAESFTIAFADGLTLGGLLTALELHPGYSGDVTQGYAPLRAAALVDESVRVLSAAPLPFAVATNPLWRWVTGIAAVLTRAAARVDVALAQLNLLTAAGTFADYWGLHTGIRRHPAAHAPLIGGVVVGLQNGSEIVEALNQSVLVQTWLAAAGSGVFQPTTFFDGALFIRGGIAIPIQQFLPKGSHAELVGPHGSDIVRLVLESPWTGPSGSFTDYQLVWLAESDSAYTARQLHEVLRPRENNLALAKLIEEDTGVIVEEVRDLRRFIFVASKTKLRGFFLAGKRYNTASAEVVLRDFPTTAAIAAARDNAAAGIRMFILGTMRLGTLSPSTLTFQTRRLIIGAVPAMKINAGTIGQHKIGPP